MDLPITADLTYHSRRRNDESSIHAFTPLNLPLKIKQNQQQRPSIISSFGTRQQFFSNPHMKQIQMLQNVSPIETLQASERKTDLKSNVELEQQRQKIRTLSEHLKSALLSNNQIQERYDLMKRKMEEKEMKFMNETSVLKAELIILQKEFTQKNDEIRKKNDEISQLKIRLEKSQRSQKMAQQKYQLQIQHIETLKKSLVDQRMQEVHFSELKQALSKKDHEISNMSEKLKSHKKKIDQYEMILKQQEEHVSKIESQLRESQKLYHSLFSENESMKEKLQFQKNRIQELNQHIGEICHNSDHLFEEIKQNQLQKEILNEKIDQKELEKISVLRQLDQMIQKLQAYEIKCEQLKMGQDILDERNQQLTQKYGKLQQENLEISKNNTELLREIQTLEQEVKELKELCLRQQTQQTELLSIIKSMEDEIHKLSRQINKEVIQKLREEVKKEIKPSKILERRTKTEKAEYFPKNQELSSNILESKVSKEYLNETKGRFNYLSEHENQNEKSQYKKQPHPYSQYLSFEPSKPYDSIKHKHFQDEYKRRTHTLKDNIEHASHLADRDRNTFNNYYLPDYKSLSKNDRKSKSFYVERKNLLVAVPDDVYKSSFNPKDNQYSSIKEMRHSLDMREKFFNLNSIQRESRRQNHNFQKSKKPQKLHMEGANFSNPYESKDIFLSKLSKLKLWSKQTSSQQTTQREALTEIPTNNDYVKAEVPIQTIIKQKSTILQQRKNLLTFNLNNQMIQKNILKLQKNGQTQKIKQNSVEGLSEIRARREDNYGSMKDTVYNVCKKVIYN